VGESLRMSRKRRQERRPANVVVPDSQVRECIGRCVTVEGKVAAVSTTADHGLRVLMLGTPSPGHTLSVWIPSEAYLPWVEGLRGRLVRVTGPIWLHDVRWPAVTVVDPRQLEVVRER